LFGGLVAWILAKQVEFNRAMITALRATREGAGAWALISVAFLYGVFHAAGPGHGKAVVSSYVFANEDVLKRAVLVALAAALLQAVVAITLVVPAVSLLGATARQVDQSVAWIEIISFSAILLLGLSLLWRKGRAFLAFFKQAPDQSLAPCPHCGSGLGIGSHTHQHHGHHHDHGAACTHVHLPDATDLAGTKSWRDLVAVVVAAGSRPCSGAIILLAFALSVGALGVGIAAVFAMAVGTGLTTAGFAVGAVLAKGATRRLAERSERLAWLTAAVECAAALAVTLLGAALLMGYLTSS
ncbi:MAG TPA: nickel transporter, partial [Beijerinckiaceae bacterium]|nr:nickel transporter [Beijerinckiaceae bacterium]